MGVPARWRGFCVPPIYTRLSHYILRKSFFFYRFISHVWLVSVIASIPRRIPTTDYSDKNAALFLNLDRVSWLSSTRPLSFTSETWWPSRRHTITRANTEVVRTFATLIFGHGPSIEFPVAPKLMSPLFCDMNGCCQPFAGFTRASRGYLIQYHQDFFKENTRKYEQPPRLIIIYSTIQCNSLFPIPFL